MTDKCGAFNWKDEEGCPAGSCAEVCFHFQSPVFMCYLGKGLFEISKELFKTFESIVLFYTPGMRSAMSVTLLIFSTSCIHQRGKASLTAGWMCWDIFSRYKATVKHPTNSVWWQNIILKCLSSREERLRPLTGITAPRWGSGLSSGSHGKWAKISDKVEFWCKSTYTKQTQTTAEFHVRLFYPSRPRVCQLGRHGVCARPQQESHLLHPCHWTKSGDRFWVSKVSCASVKGHLLYIWGSFVFTSSQAQNAQGAVVAEI